MESALGRLWFKATPIHGGWKMTPNRNLSPRPAEVAFRARQSANTGAGVSGEEAGGGW